MSDRVFPGISNITEKQGNEVKSNLPLQMSLYFNVIYAPFWFFIILTYLNEKLEDFTHLHKFVIITTISIAILVEILRLYLGYEGNLKDKVPELAGFWMLSILLQFPVQGILLFTPHLNFRVLDIISQSIMFIMLIAEIISGYIALKFTAAQQAIFFRIMKMDGDISMADIQEKYRIN
ncbi:transmembrane protein 17-like isoform X2 [Harmonia axyridis]|nr:transmembrane protein 17-like isoform X2 [Harmonia axyridis]